MPDDQARGLRAMFSRTVCPSATIALCGSESARMAAEIACALGAIGHRVLLLDRTRGEVATALGVRARYDLQHALRKHRRLAEVVVAVDERVTLLPAARGLDAVALTTRDWRTELEAAVPGLQRAFDLWVLNGPLPGVAPDARVLLALAPTAYGVTAAYGHIKALARAQGRRSFGVVVHEAADADAARKVFDCVAETAGRFLSAELEFIGYVPRESARRPIVAARGVPPGAAFMTIARAIAAGLSCGAEARPVLL